MRKHFLVLTAIALIAYSIFLIFDDREEASPTAPKPERQPLSPSPQRQQQQPHPTEQEANTMFEERVQLEVIDSAPPLQQVGTGIKQYKFTMPKLSDMPAVMEQFFFHKDIEDNSPETEDLIVDFYARLAAWDETGELHEGTSLTCKQKTCVVSSSVTPENEAKFYFSWIDIFIKQSKENRAYISWECRKRNNGKTLVCFLGRNIEDANH